MSGPDFPVKEMSFKEKVKFFLSCVTVEPITICYILPSVMSFASVYNLNLEKACRVNLAYPTHVCDAISVRQFENYTKEEQEVQKLVSSMFYWQSTLKSALPALLILFLGSFSDRSGRRKPFMLVPMFGEFFMALGLILCTYFYLDWSMEVAGIIEGLFPALSGGMATFSMAIFSYVADVSLVSSRTVRIGIVNVFVTIAAPVGTLSQGYLYEAIGFYGVFTLASALYAIGIIYGILKLKEVRNVRKLQHSFIRELLDPKHALETFCVVFKRRKGNIRLRIILIMIVSLTTMGPMAGENNLGYLFVRYHFKWDAVDFSHYLTFATIITLLGNTVTVAFFTHMLKMDDAMLGIIGCLSKIVACFFYAFSDNSLIFYLGTIIDMIGGIPLLAMRSIASKLVASEELGKIYSLFGLCDAVVPIIYPPVYSYVYNQTIDKLPGAFFLLSASSVFVTMAIFGHFYYLHKTEFTDKNEDSPEMDNENEAKTNEGFVQDEQPNLCIDTKL